MSGKRDLLTLMDYTGEELNELLNTADQLKYEQKNHMAHPKLQGKTLGMVFQQNSTRTRVSFEAGMYQLGGLAMFLSARDLQMEQGEPVQDTARVLSGYLDGLMVRTDRHADAVTLAEFATVPVINGMTDYAHPCQALGDLMTIREYKRTFKGKKLAYIGPGSNVCNSVVVGALKVGMEVTVACPEGFGPAKAVLDWAETMPGFACVTDPESAVLGADVVYAGIWGKNTEETRKKVFSNYRVDDILIGKARPDAIVLHSLPAHRGEEITAGVFEEHAGEIFRQAENRMHGQKAILTKLLGEA